MATNRGKQFEQQIREAFERVEDTTITRLIDPQAGYSGVRNICDFIVYHYPKIYYIECKSHKGNTFPFSCITQNQFDGMLDMSKTRGVVAGVIVWYIDHDKTYFVPIQTISEMQRLGQKSLNVNDVGKDWIEIKAKKKRVLFEYDMHDFLWQTF